MMHYMLLVDDERKVYIQQDYYFNKEMAVAASKHRVSSEHVEKVTIFETYGDGDTWWESDIIYSDGSVDAND